MVSYWVGRVYKEKVNAITKEVVTLSNTTYITSDTLIQFLKMLKEKYSDKPIAIVLDNKIKPVYL